MPIYIYGLASAGLYKLRLFIDILLMWTISRSVGRFTNGPHPLYVYIFLINLSSTPGPLDLDIYLAFHDRRISARVLWHAHMHAHSQNISGYRIRFCRPCPCFRSLVSEKRARYGRAREEGSMAPAYGLGPSNRVSWWHGPDRPPDGGFFQGEHSGIIMHNFFFCIKKDIEQPNLAKTPRAVAPHMHKTRSKSCL